MNPSVFSCPSPHVTQRWGGGLGPVNVEKSYHGKEGHPPSRVNSHVHVSECLYEKKIYEEPTVALAHALIVLP